MRRRLLDKKEQGLLPDGYTECEYIENTSNAYIDTKFIPTATTNIDMRFLESDNNAKTRTIIGRKAENGVDGRYVFNNYNKTNNEYKYFFAINNNQSDIVLKQLVIKTLRIKINEGDLNGQNFSVIGSLSYYPISLYLFANNSAGTPINQADNVKIYYCKLWNNNKLERNYIPARRDSDGKYGLYDIVNNTFNLSPNGTPFFGMPKVKLPKGYTQLEYIENNSNAYIDTGYKPNNNTGINIDINVTKHVTWGGFFGGRGPRYTPAFANACYDDGSTLEAFWSNPYKRFRIPKSILGRHIINWDKNIYSFDGQNYTLDTTPYQVPVNMFLFAMSDNGVVQYGGVLSKIYFCKIWENGKDIRKYIPAKRKSDNAIGLYDTVNKTFNLSPNDTPFTGGAEVDPQPPTPTDDETININLVSSDPSKQGELKGAKLRVSYVGFQQDYTWQGATISIKVAPNTQVTITYFDHVNFTKPSDNTFTTVEGNTRQIKATYTYVSPKPVLPPNGAYILGLDNIFYTASTWDQPKENVLGVAVIKDNVKVIVYTEWFSNEGKWIQDGTYAQGVLTSEDVAIASKDFEGEKNTDILAEGGSSDLIAVKIKNVKFKNGQTAYIPALGELLAICSCYNEIYEYERILHASILTGTAIYSSSTQVKWGYHWTNMGADNHPYTVENTQTAFSLAITKLNL